MWEQYRGHPTVQLHDVTDFQARVLLPKAEVITALGRYFLNKYIFALFKLLFPPKNHQQLRYSWPSQLHSFNDPHTFLCATEGTADYELIAGTNNEIRSTLEINLSTSLKTVGSI